MKRILLYGLLLVAMSIQAQDVLPYPMDTIDGKVYYRYTVEKSIGLYRISKNFGVSQEAILQANPDLATRGLKFEEVILIPTAFTVAPKPAEPVKKVKLTEMKKQESKQPQFVEAVMAVKRDSAQETIPLPMVAAEAEQPMNGDTSLTAQAETQDSLQEVRYIDTIRLAYLLPLHAEIAQRSPSLDRFYDFYCGSLLAIKHHDTTYVDSLGGRYATYYDIHTYDVGKLGNVVCQLIDSGALANMDAIIGPAYMKQVEVLSAYVEEHHIPTLIPFLPQLTPKLNENPYLLKFNPADQIHTGALMQYLDTMRSRINIVLVDAYEKRLDYPIGIRTLRDSISARSLPTTHTSIRQILADSVGAALKDSVENILLFHSERYSNVQLLMPYLLSGRRGKQLTVLSQYAWQIERIILPQLFTSVFRTPDSEEEALYERDFVHYFGHKLSSEQPRYDLLGYDLTAYMLENLRQDSFQPADTIYEGLQSTILFNKKDNGGYENNYIVIERR